MNALKERTFKETILKKAFKASPDDMIIVSDVDEIPNLEENNLNNIKNKIILFNQKFFTINLI